MIKRVYALLMGRKLFHFLSYAPSSAFSPSLWFMENRPLSYPDSKGRFFFASWIRQPDANKVIHLSFSGFLDGDNFPFIGNGGLFFRIVLYNPCPDANLTFGYHISCYYFKRFICRLGFSGFLTALVFLFLSVGSGWSSSSFKV